MAETPMVSAGGIVVAVAENQFYVALVRRTDGFWVLPKGHVDSDEELTLGALREIEEETGLLSERLQLSRYLSAHPFNEFEPSRHDLKINHFFLFRYLGDTLPELKTDKAHRDAAWHMLPLDGVDMRYQYQKALVDSIADEVGLFPRA